jgi:uncharacterized protein YciI
MLQWLLKISILVSILVSVLVSILEGLLATAAQAAEAPNLFVLAYAPGVHWQQGAEFDAQPGSLAHQAYVQALYANEILVMAGPLDDGSRDAGSDNLPSDRLVSMILVSVASPDQALVIAKADPLYQAQVVQIKVLPWRVQLSSMHIRKRHLPLSDEIAPYMLERIDPNSPINIKD